MEKKDYYFSGYSNFDIHEEMLEDKVRTLSYKDAIEKNAHIFKDKIVLDIGCGTGVLSIFAARAGAKHVYGIDNADIAYSAREIVRKNKLSDKITIIKSMVEEAVLPVEKVDIIVSEWMGYFLLHESMLESVLYARDKWLKKDGYMLPDRFTMTIAALHDEVKSQKLRFWDDVYGIDMSIIKPSAISRAEIHWCLSKNINSSACKIKEIDLYTVKKEELQFTAAYELAFSRKDTVHGIIGWFDTYFEKLPNQVQFSTSPYVQPTHWKQTVFYTQNGLHVEQGEVLKGSIAVRKSVEDHRDIDIKMSFHFNGKSKKRDWLQLFKIYL